MKLNENQLEIQSKTMFLKDILPIFHKKLPFASNFNATEMNKMNYDLRFVTFKKIERMMEISQFYDDLYSVTLPNESKLHEEKNGNFARIVDDNNLCGNSGRGNVYGTKRKRRQHAIPCFYWCNNGRWLGLDGSFERK